jgi:hypothetical protein
VGWFFEIRIKQTLSPAPAATRLVTFDLESWRLEERKTWKLISAGLPGHSRAIRTLLRRRPVEPRGFETLTPTMPMFRKAPDA